MFCGVLGKRAGIGQLIVIEMNVPSVWKRERAVGANKCVYDVDEEDSRTQND